MKMKIYIAGKITGDKGYREKFAAVEAALWAQGFTVINPAVLPEGMRPEDYMRVCLAMVEIADEVVFLPDWQESQGGKIGDGAVPVHQKAHRVFAGRLRDSNCTWKHWGTECKFAGCGRKENTWERKRKLTGATAHGTRSQDACMVVHTAMRGGLRRDLAAIHQTKNCTSLTCGRW